MRTRGERLQQGLLGSVTIFVTNREYCCIFYRLLSLLKHPHQLHDPISLNRYRSRDSSLRIEAVLGVHQWRC